MDLVLLESLLAVAEHGTLTRAARAVAVTQPALTRRLQQLEDAMGAPLLVRSKRGAVLTDAGRLVAAEGRQLVERWRRLRESVRAQQNLEAGLVRLGGGATAVSFLVPTTIAEFGALYPGVRFEVREEGSRAVEDDVVAERLELGIVTLPTRSRELEVRPLRRDRIVLVAGARHPLAGRRWIDVGALQGLGLVGFESDSAIRRLIDDALRGAGVTMNVQMELRSIAAILEMVARTQLLGFVSQLGVEGRGRELGVRVVQVRGLSIDRRLAVISKLGRPLSSAARAFAAMLR
ncbi:MAG: LysR family transcriptional regulator [Deltaproteobacteria bacterium]|nr:LysR family transcriptional regulator [Deltaproteobacteria bacterium]